MLDVCFDMNNLRGQKLGAFDVKLHVMKAHDRVVDFVDSCHMF